MPISYQYKPDLNLVISIHVGNISDDEFLAFYKSFFEYIDFDTSCKYLVDLRRAESKTRSPMALHKLADYLKKHNKRISIPERVAVVAPRHRSFELACNYEAISNGAHGEFEIFRDIPAALEWLNVPEKLADGIELNGWPASP